ncbi:MAG TPA: hypothetical protein V6C76_09650 [Drouetiella sp.]
MSLVDTIKKEAREIAGIILYLGFWLPILATMKCLILLDYGINEFKNAYITAFISALLLAKVIVIGQNLKITNRMRHKPLFWSCLYKAAFFTVITTIGHRIEEHFTHPKVDPNQVFPLAGTVCHAIALFGIFFALFAYRDLDEQLGAGTLKKIFFKPREAANS